VTTATGLARVTVSAPRRRLDVALPEHAPLAELLPALLRHAGEGLPDAGQAHGGWLLRRADGSPLSVGAGLVQQGVRDGDVLHLVPARAGWPELEYDDVVDAIAAGSRRHGRAWDGAATRAAGLAAAGLVLLVGLLPLLRSPAGSPAPAAVALAVAGLLVLGGVVASRGYGEGVAGATLGGYALPYALAGGYLLLRGLPGLLVGATALLLAGMIGAVGVGYGLRVFVAGITAGGFGVLGALLAYRQSAAAAAAVVLAVLMTGVAAFPLLAIRLGRLPIPVPTADAGARPDRARVFAAVARADELVTGMLLGHAAATLAAVAVVVQGGGAAGRILAALCAAGFLTRARLFPTVRQRLPLLGSGAGAAGLLFVGAPGVPPTALAAGLAGLALLAALAGTVYRRRAPGPYLGRAADILDAGCVIAVIPVACGVLGLYGRMRGLIG
jgi:type VII secretion integral membrane protein EccD